MISADERSRTKRRATPIGVALLAGAALVWLAIPRVVSALAGLPAGPIISELRAGEQKEPRYLQIAANSQRSALAWIDDGRGWGWLGLLAFLQAQGRGFGDDARALLDVSIAAHRRGLALSPAQTYAWARLAHAELLRKGPSPQLGKWLALSMVSAPYEKRLVFQRLELCFLVWRQLDDRVRARVAEQVRFAARYKLGRLAKLAKRRYVTGIVRAALVDVPDLRHRLDAALLRL